MITKQFTDGSSNVYCVGMTVDEIIKKVAGGTVFITTTEIMNGQAIFIIDKETPEIIEAIAEVERKIDELRV